MANVTVTVLEADGTTETDVEVLGFGRQAAAASKSTAMSTEDKSQLDAAVTALQVIDDWDESDRAKVNPIVGQAGVQGGSGAVSAATQRMVLATDVPLPAGTNLTGRVSASQETSTIYNGTTALTPKFKVISCSSSGNNEIVAAVSGKKIRVLAWDVSPSDVVNFKWRTANTDITGLYYAANAGNGVSKSFSPVGYFETASDEALNLNLSAAEAVGGSLVYVEV